MEKSISKKSFNYKKRLSFSLKALNFYDAKAFKKFRSKDVCEIWHMSNVSHGIDKPLTFFCYKFHEKDFLSFKKAFGTKACQELSIEIISNFLRTSKLFLNALY